MDHWKVGSNGSEYLKWNNVELSVTISGHLRSVRLPIPETLLVSQGVMSVESALSGVVRQLTQTMAREIEESRRVRALQDYWMPEESCECGQCKCKDKPIYDKLDFPDKANWTY